MLYRPIQGHGLSLHLFSSPRMPFDKNIYFSKSSCTLFIKLIYLYFKFYIVNDKYVYLIYYWWKNTVG